MGTGNCNYLILGLMVVPDWNKCYYKIMHNVYIIQSKLQVQEVTGKSIS
jgi:hypothetical protein